MGHNCLHVRFFLLDLDLDLRSLDLDLDLPSLKRTWTRTWTCSLKVDLDLDLRIVDLDLDFTVAGLVTSLLDGEYLGRFYKKANGQQEKSSRLPLQCVTKPCPAGCRHFTAINTVEIGDCPRASDDAVMMQ